MYEQINDPIEVLAGFKRGQIIPYRFKWGIHQYDVKKVNLVHGEMRGRDMLYYFSVSDEANYFKLCFDASKMLWKLEEMMES